MGLFRKSTKQNTEESERRKRINELSINTETEAAEYHDSYNCYDTAVCGAIHFFGEDGTRRDVLIKPDRKEEQYAEAVGMIKECGYYAVLVTFCVREVFPDNTVTGIERSYLFNKYCSAILMFSSSFNNHDGASQDGKNTHKTTVFPRIVPPELYHIRMAVGEPE